MVFCGVKDCKNNTGRKKTCPCLLYFTLPVKEPSKSKWLKILDQENIPFASQTKLQVCSSHFDRDELVYTIHNKYELKYEAIPKVLLQHNQSNCLLSEDGNMDNLINSEIEDKYGIDSTIETDYGEGICESYTKVDLYTNKISKSIGVSTNMILEDNDSSRGTQTDFEDEPDKRSFVNMFFCTIHNDKDVETYCNLQADDKCGKDFIPQLRVRTQTPVMLKQSTRIKNQKRAALLENLKRRKSPRNHSSKKMRKLYIEEVSEVQIKKEIEDYGLDENNPKETIDDIHLPTDWDIGNVDHFEPDDTCPDDPEPESKVVEEPQKAEEVPNVLMKMKEKDDKSEFKKENHDLESKIASRLNAKLEKIKKRKRMKLNKDQKIPGEPEVKKKRKRKKIIRDGDCAVVFPCDLCRRSFTIRDNLNRHKATCHSDIRHQCENCEKTFKRKDALSIHLYKAHPDKVDPSKLNAAKNKIKAQGMAQFKCTYCEKCFVREQSFLDHQAKNMEPLECKACKKTFECRTMLWIHRNKEHPATCEICNKVCTNKAHLNTHRKLHDPKFECEVCFKKFPFESTYKNHVLTHSKERPFSCDLCGKTFMNAPSVSQHKWQVHQENNKKYQCTICFKAFLYKAKVECHMRTHTGEKPFMCDTCGATFSQNCALKAHIRSIHGVYVQSVKDDGTVEMQLVKYKRAPRKTSRPRLPEDGLENHQIPQSQNINLGSQSMSVSEANIDIPIATTSTGHPSTSSNLNYSQNSVQDLTTRTLQEITTSVSQNIPTGSLIQSNNLTNLNPHIVQNIRSSNLQTLGNNIVQNLSPATVQNLSNTSVQSLTSPTVQNLSSPNVQNLGSPPVQNLSNSVVQNLSNHNGLQSLSLSNSVVQNISGVHNIVTNVQSVRNNPGLNLATNVIHNLSSATPHNLNSNIVHNLTSANHRNLNAPNMAHDLTNNTVQNLSNNVIHNLSNNTVQNLSNNVLPNSIQYNNHNMMVNSFHMM